MKANSLSLRFCYAVRSCQLSNLSWVSYRMMSCSRFDMILQYLKWFNKIAKSLWCEKRDNKIFTFTKWQRRYFLDIFWTLSTDLVTIKCCWWNGDTFWVIMSINLVKNNCIDYCWQLFLILLWHWTPDNFDGFPTQKRSVEKYQKEVNRWFVMQTSN